MGRLSQVIDLSGNSLQELMKHGNHSKFTPKAGGEGWGVK